MAGIHSRLIFGTSIVCADYSRDWNDGSTAPAVYYTSTQSVVAQQLNLAQNGVVGSAFGRASFETITTAANLIELDVDFLWPGDGTIHPGEGVLAWWRTTAASLGATTILPDGYSIAVTTPLPGVNDVRISIWPGGAILASAGAVGTYHTLAHFRVTQTGPNISATISGGGLGAPITLTATDATWNVGTFGLASITTTGAVPISSIFDNLVVHYCL